MFVGNSRRLLARRSSDAGSAPRFAVGQRRCRNGGRAPSSTADGLAPRTPSLRPPTKSRGRSSSPSPSRRRQNPEAEAPSSGCAIGDEAGELDLQRGNMARAAKERLWMSSGDASSPTRTPLSLTRAAHVGLSAPPPRCSPPTSRWVAVLALASPYGELASAWRRCPLLHHREWTTTTPEEDAAEKSAQESPRALHSAGPKCYAIFWRTD
jgi:hypothetical protein